MSSPSHMWCTSLGNSTYQCGKLFKELNMYRCVHYSLWRSPLTNLKCKTYYLEAKLFWISNWASWYWCCYRTLSSIVEEDIEEIFYALDDNGDLKVHFLHRFLFIVNVFLVDNELLHQMFGILSLSWIWCVGCLQIDREENVDLCNTISLNLKGQTRGIAFVFAFGWRP